MFGGKGMDFPPFGGKGMPFPPPWLPPMFKGGKGGGGWMWSNSNESERPEPPPHDNLYVKNLPPGIKEEEVCATFGTEGDVVECRILTGDGFSECAALVRMATVEQATKVKEKYNDTVHEKCHQTIKVTVQQKRGESVA